MLTTPKWENWRVADELHKLKTAAAQLQVRFGLLCRNAEPSVRLRMDKMDALDLDLMPFCKAANELAIRLQAEADAEVT